MRNSKPYRRRSGLKPLLILLLVLIVGVTGTVFAYMFKRTEFKENSLIPAKVSCALDEAFDGTQKTNITVKNTGNIDAYIRVRLVTYWEKDGEIAAKPSKTLSVTPNANWVPGTNNTYYYELPVEPNGVVDLINTPITLIEEDGYKQVVDVFAEAIQSLPTDAVTNSWGVTVNGDGSIINAP